MSKDQTDTHLRYGQGILLKGYKPEKDPLQGCLTVKGFADTKCCYETIEDILYFKNYRNAIFEFLPAGNFEINDELCKLKQKIVDTEEEEIKRKSAIQTLAPRAQSEKNQFELTIKTKRKSTIKFGDYVIFRHVDSQSYLSGTIGPSEGTNGAFSVEVSEQLSSFLIFQVLPFRSFDNQSMQIPFDSPVLLKNISNNGYLTFENIDPNEGKLDNKYIVHKPTQSDESYRIPVKTRSLTSQRFEIVTHFCDLSIQDEINPMPWIFQIHFKEVENDSLVQHDIVFLQHTQNNGILSAIGLDVILKESKQETQQALPFYESLWEIEKHDVTPNSYILRHLMSGMTFGIQRNEADQPYLPKLFDISSGKNEAELGVVQLKLAKKEGGVINSQSYVNIAWEDYTVDIDPEEENEDDDNFGKSSMGIGDIIPLKKMKKAAKNEIEYTVKKLKFTGDISKHCFVIQEIDDSLKKQLLFALSFHSTIINLREDLKLGAVEATKRISYIRMMKVTEKISEIIGFLKVPNESNQDLEFVPNSRKKQLICKDLGLSELLFELLFFMNQNMNEDIFKDKANQHDKFLEMYQTIYEVIKNLIVNNKIFKIHVSKWIMFILNDVIYKNEEIYFKVLMELLKDNKFFTENFVTPQLIEYLFEKMLLDKNKKEFSEKRYIQILRKFCICGDTILSNNQVLILNNFIEKLSSHPQASIYLIQLILKDGQIYVRAALDKVKLRQYKFADFLQLCKETIQGEIKVPRYPDAWEYYKVYLNMLADLTQGRSKQIQRYISALLPLDMMTQLFEKYELNEFEVPIIKVFHYLYFQNEHFYPIEQQKRIISFEQINEEEDLKVNHFTSNISPWEKLQRVLIAILNKLKNGEPILPENKNKNQALYELLCITRETLNLGFWNKKQDIKEIYVCVRKILKPSMGIIYEEVTKIKEQNTMMIECKKQCMNIIDLIINQDMNMSLQIINRIFKSFEFPQSASEFSLEISKLLQVPGNIEFAEMFLDAYRQKIAQYEAIVGEDFLQQIVELPKYKDAELTKLGLSVFEKIYNNDKNRFERFYQELFICEKERVNFNNYLISLRNQFFTLEDFNAPLITYENQSNNYYEIYKQPGGVMQDIHYINELMKNQNSLEKMDQIKNIDDSTIFARLATDNLINFTNQRKSSNLPKQKLVDATNIHHKVLSYIVNCQQIPESELASKLLHICYKFLVALIENHQEIKSSFERYLPVMMNHLSSNIGVLDFMKQMYDNNKNMLFNEGELSSLIRKVCQIVENQGNTFYKSKVFDFLRYLIYLNNKPLKTNQILILKIIQDDEYKNIMLRPTTQKITEVVDEYYRKNGANYEFSQGQVVCSQELTYMTTFFQILTSLIDQNNRVNSGKLEKRFAFDNLLDMIKVCGKCYFLKRNVRAFLNRMYYFESGTDAYINQIIKEDLVYILDDINEIIKVKFREDVARIEKMKFQNGVRFSYYESYMYLNLAQILFTLHSILNTDELYREIVSFIQKYTQSSVETVQNFMKIAERLGCLRNYYTSHKNIETTSIIKFLQKRLKKLLEVLPIQAFQPGFKGKQEQITDPKQKKSYMIDKLINGDINEAFKNGGGDENLPISFLTENKPIQIKQRKEPNWDVLNNQIRLIFTRKKREFESKDEEVKYKMDKIVSGLKMSPSIRVKLTQSFQQKLINSTSYTNSILQYLSQLIAINNDDPELFSDQLKVFILNILISIFQQTNPIEGGEVKQIDQWQAEDWESNQKKIQSLQLKFKKNNIGSFITTLAKGNICDNIKLANSILLCGISYLLGGNKTTQNNIREELNNDSDNKVLKNIRNLIIKLGGLIRKCIDEDKAHLFKKEDENIEDFVPTTIDNYDFYSVEQKLMTRKNVEQPHYTDQALYYQQCIVTYRRAFKFMQLLCENNNTENKNFIREQPDTSESIDFIELAAKQLRNIFISVCSDIADIPIFILDFILEVTQIPIIANQQAFIKSSFFEDLCLLMNTLEKDGQKENRGFADDQEPIIAILEKSIEIILSNLEGGDENNYRLLDQKLEPGFLVTFLRKKLKMLEIGNQEEFQNYVEDLKKPQKNQQGKIEAQTEFDDKILSILNIMIIFMKLKDVLADSSKIYNAYNKEKEANDDNIGLFTTLQVCLLKIEIADSLGKKQFVYFANHPLFNSLSGGIKDYIMQNVARSTHRQKIVSLLGYVPEVESKMRQSYHYQKVEQLSEEDMLKNYQKASSLSMFICFYITMFYEIFIERGSAEYGSGMHIGVIRLLLSLLQFYYSLKYIYIWYTIKIWYKPQQTQRQEQTVANVTEQEGQGEGQGKPQGQIEEQQSRIKRIISEIKRYIQIPIDLLTTEEQTFYMSKEFFKISLFVMVSFIGTFIYPPILFIHILDFLLNSPLLGSIVKAIVQVTKPLILVSFMGVVFTFIFCAVTLSNYVKNVYEDTSDEDEMCTGMIQCILELFVSGVILETMEDFQIVRFTYDTIYSIFFGMLFTNIVQGLLLDAFGEIRSNDESLNDDKKNKCYICNVSRQQVEQEDETFDDHTLKKHYLWNYIFYIITLDNKNPTDYTGLEYYISQKYNLPDNDMDVDWIPDGEKAFELLKALDKMGKRLDDRRAKVERSSDQLKQKIEEFNSITQL